MVNEGYGSLKSPIFFPFGCIYLENAMTEKNNEYYVEDVQKRIGTILRLVRQLSSGYTQEELSRKCNLSTKTIMRAERGKSVSTKNFWKIIDALDMDVQEAFADI